MLSLFFLTFLLFVGVTVSKLYNTKVILPPAKNISIGTLCWLLGNGLGGRGKLTVVLVSVLSLGQGLKQAKLETLMPIS